MHSMAIVEWGKALKPVDTPNPVPQGTEVLVRVTGCGVCHSDIHIQDGVMDMGGGRKVEYGKVGFKLPHTLGHEIVGEVVALGPDATGAKIGDKRMSCFRGSAAASASSASAARNYCAPTAAPSACAPMAAMPTMCWCRIPKYLVDFSGVNEALAATYACSGLTAYSALRKLAHLGPEETIVIIGAGGVGLSAVMIAPAAVKARIVVADISDRKRDAALKAGASAVYDNNDKDAIKNLRAATQFGAGAGGAIDFVGAPATAQFGVNALRRGGTMVQVGLAGGDTPFGILTFMQRMLTITGSYVGSLEELKELMALVKAGKVPAIPVATRPLKDVNLVLDDMRAGKINGRIVVTP